jgi:hypothetical protein
MTYMKRQRYRKAVADLDTHVLSSMRYTSVLCTSMDQVRSLWQGQDLLMYLRRTFGLMYWLRVQIDVSCAGYQAV